MDLANATPLPTGAEPVDLDRGSIRFVGNATTLIHYGGFTILTDPNFLHAGDHAHLGYGLTSRRLIEPALPVEDLPPLDLCVLSHLHGDHWDHIAAQRLRKDLPIVTTPHASRGLRRQGFTATRPLATWEASSFTRGSAWLRITALPGRHGPPVVAKLLPPVMGSLLEWGSTVGPPRFRLYISGDTMVFADLKEIPQRFPEIDLALVHLGGTRALGIVVTMTPEQGIRCLRIVRPKEAIPIHYNDYDAFKSPLDDPASGHEHPRGARVTTFEDFVRQAEQAIPGLKVHILRHGESYHFEVAAVR